MNWFSSGQVVIFSLTCPEVTCNPCVKLWVGLQLRENSLQWRSLPCDLSRVNLRCVRWQLEKAPTWPQKEKSRKYPTDGYMDEGVHLNTSKHSDHDPVTCADCSAYNLPQRTSSVTFTSKRKNIYQTLQSWTFISLNWALRKCKLTKFAFCKSCFQWARTGGTTFRGHFM